MYFFIQLVFILFSCDTKLKHDIINTKDTASTCFLKDKNGKLVVFGQYDKKYRKGVWEYNDNFGNTLLKTEYIDLRDSSIRQNRYYNSIGKLIYIESIGLSNVINELFIMHYPEHSKNILVGKYLHKEYCSSCHDYNLKLLSRSYKVLINNDTTKFSKFGVSRFNSKSSLTYHRDVKQLLSNNEIQDILAFIVNQSNPIP
jgi:hypothetical protein